MRTYTFLPGFSSRTTSALALAALRPGGGPTPFTCTIGPLVRREGPPEERWTGVAVDIGLYPAPDAADPIHSTLTGLATEVATGVFARKFFLRDLVAHVPPLVNRVIYGCADGPGFRVVLPLRVIPDAQRYR